MTGVQTCALPISGADEALMLDPHGFVASCNSTNFFIVRGDELWTSTGRYNFKGITRRKITELYREHGGVVREIEIGTAAAMRTAMTANHRRCRRLAVNRARWMAYGAAIAITALNSM